jgi:hypothetical protein
MRGWRPPRNATAQLPTSLVPAQHRAKLRRELAILHPARAASFSASLGGVADWPTCFPLTAYSACSAQ